MITKKAEAWKRLTRLVSPPKTLVQVKRMWEHQKSNNDMLLTPMIRVTGIPTRATESGWRGFPLGQQSPGGGDSRFG
ncbi:hypothetical protein E2C01_062778 [Portunus trituberculatus]|uniref:Uncharacterized protein n=1 Tax=Portunus trituberculatus TaxID=210409 RepID=A0A5B7HF01_PORTR|nr:hypothetical protein [Portunus trituberculatus]